MICKNKFIIALICSLILFVNPVTANDLINGYWINYTNSALFETGINKFSLTNISAAHDDFKNLISSASNKDVVLLKYAISLAEFGFFDLTDAIFSKIDDYEISKNYIREIKQFYYPAKRLTDEQIKTLAEAYSNIAFNDYAQEAVLDIINGNLVQQNSDYIYYILCLGLYETKDFAQAKNYIALALSQNPNNINYKILEIKVLLELNEYKKVTKLLAELKKVEPEIKELRNKILALEQFVYYKTQKNPTIKNIHLAHYYILQGKISAAQRVLLSNLGNNKKTNGEIYSLLAKTYFYSDSNKALEYATKALNNKFENNSSYYIIGLEKFKENNIKQALKTLNKTKLTDESGLEAKNLIAEITFCSNKVKQAKKLFQNLVKKYPANSESYYYLAKLDTLNAENLLKKSLSYNITFKPAYYELSRIYTERENYITAREILNNLRYIDENDFKYYYYLSRLEFAQGNSELAKEHEAHCYKLEPNFRDIINRENNIEK